MRKDSAKATVEFIQMQIQVNCDVKDDLESHETTKTTCLDQRRKVEQVQVVVGKFLNFGLKKKGLT